MCFVYITKPLRTVLNLISRSVRSMTLESILLQTSRSPCIQLQGVACAICFFYFRLCISKACPCGSPFPTRTRSSRAICLALVCRAWTLLGRFNKVHNWIFSRMLGWIHECYGRYGLLTSLKLAGFVQNIVGPLADSFPVCFFQETYLLNLC